MIALLTKNNKILLPCQLKEMVIKFHDPIFTNEGLIIHHAW